MHKILVEVKNKTLSFSLLSSRVKSENLNNTNVIDTEKMVFSDKYINDNLELIKSFFNDIILKKEIERSLITKFRKDIYSKFVKAVKDFNLIEENDVIGVCISGGKDSFLLAKCIQELKRHGKIKFDYEPKISILVPMYKGLTGIDEINNNVQNIFNEKNKVKLENRIGDVIFRENDKVIQLSNMPEENVYNGDIGLIDRILLSPKKEIYIDFDSNIVKYTPANFINFRLAYAISIHKAQGSEFDVVILPLVKAYNKMLYRKLVYTAVTRAKRKLYLIGDISALEMAVSNTKTDIRRTTIKDFLINGIK